MSSALAPPLARGHHRSGKRARRGSTLFALLRANALYWPTVAPVAREQLAHWEARARTIDDPSRRALALRKLREERFNPQLAATLATRAPRARRRAVTEAIVALQVAYDYLDAVEECSPDARADAHRDGYVRELANLAERRVAGLPGAATVAAAARRARERFERAQALGHAAKHSGEEELRRWAGEQAQATSLRWPEWLAGAQASVLSLHALTAAAAREGISPAQAEALDLLYLSIGALTMLDSLIDREQDQAVGEPGYACRYENGREMGERLGAVAREVLERSAGLPDGAHHRMTMLGVIAFYASAREARDPEAREVFEVLKVGVGRRLAPAFAVIWVWRRAKRAIPRRGPLELARDVRRRA